jgi:hypothetical protein
MKEQEMTEKDWKRLKKELKHSILMLPILYITLQVYAYMIGEALIRYFK